MATNLKKHAHRLAVLGRGTPDERKRVLRDAPESLHGALAEVARLVLAGKLKLTPDQRTRVLRHVNAIRKLAHQKTKKKSELICCAHSGEASLASSLRSLRALQRR